MHHLVHASRSNLRASAAIASVAVLALVASGCALSTSAGVGPSVDTDGQIGGEGRLTFRAAGGAPELQVGLATTLGLGWLESFQTYGEIGAEISVEGGGDQLRWEVGVPLSLRFVRGGFAPGGGIAVSALYAVDRTEAENGAILVGPRVSLEGVSGPRDDEGRGLVVVGVVVRWVMFDSTGVRWQ